MDTNVVNVVFCLDDNYARYVATVIRSIVKNLFNEVALRRDRIVGRLLKRC